MDTNVETLARCRLLALAAMQRAANVAVARPGPVVAAPMSSTSAAAEREQLACFAPAVRSRILEILDRLPD